ncbi:two-component sensor histidine kinase [Actinomyces sp. Chiba101]|uniref:histidine kinase n=1 Tax=Actinomyces denticolens TaxID=52767 RepID=A0ABY1IG76_9ACTO|nr:MULTISPECIES: histidine kinase [Actinomyces]BAW92718.1 two-component sensor histidine kinase [Actinomyces sp. Chiba101]GAV94317.1 two-component system sensor histidine kinase [Actinomyces denticolens]SHJ12878.1 Signal transduction histidine kinase [Actinomyces denticolens]SUU07440.1 Sensor histidine kinase desK [Actinomyces denticolens]
MNKAIARLRAQVDPVGLALVLLILWSSSSPAGVPRAIPPLSGAGRSIYLGLLVVCSAALVVRRRHPLAFVLVSGLAMTAHAAAFTQISTFAVVITLIATITTQSRLVAPWRWALLGSVYVGVGLEVLLAAHGLRLRDRLDPTGYGPLYWYILLGSSWTVITLAAFIGDARRRRRERYERAIERAAVLEAQQDAERRLAVSAERNRIARGVHDAVGHSLSAIAMQAEGARAVMVADPEAASEALAVIGRTSRASIEEVRALLEVLRDDDSPATIASAAPDPGESAAAVGSSAGGTPAAPAPVGPLAVGAQAPGGGPSLLGIIQEARLAGLPVALSLTTQCEAPTSAADVLARVTRESLANILRHAPGAATRIQMRVTGSECAVEVVNDAGGPDEGPGSGLGLSGMRQRVEALGGSLSAGPRPEGGWRVAVRLPADPASTAVGEEQT